MAAKPSPLIQQAQAYANAAVPTAASINQQYGQQSGDTTKFTSALIGLLQAQGKTDPYGSAVASQTSADQASAARLQALGLPGGAGAAAAVGGMGDASLGGLNAARGATGAYLNKMPGVAAATGQAGLRAIQSAKNTALDQRQQTYRSALTQAEQQLQQFGLQKQQLKQSANQFAAQQKLAWATLNSENIRASQAQKQQYAEFLQTEKDKANSATGVSPALRTQGIQMTHSLIVSGTPIQSAINQVATLGLPPAIAKAIVVAAYGNIPAPSKFDRDASGTPMYYNSAGKFMPVLYQQHLSTYQSMVASFNNYMRAITHQPAVNGRGNQKGGNTTPPPHRSAGGSPSKPGKNPNKTPPGWKPGHGAGG